MSNLFDGQKIDVPCPKCGHKMKKDVGGFKRHQKFTCTKCGVAFDFDASDFIKKRDALTDKLKKMGFK